MKILDFIKGLNGHEFSHTYVHMHVLYNILIRYNFKHDYNSFNHN